MILSQHSKQCSWLFFLAPVGSRQHLKSLCDGMDYFAMRTVLTSTAHDRAVASSSTFIRGLESRGVLRLNAPPFSFFDSGECVDAKNEHERSIQYKNNENILDLRKAWFWVKICFFMIGWWSHFCSKRVNLYLRMRRCRKCPNLLDSGKKQTSYIDSKKLWFSPKNSKLSWIIANGKCQISQR